jgi:site-specific DNA-methyltransferase (adenine-specific)/modification methylase
MPTFGDCELAWTNSPRKSVKKYEIEYNGLIGKEKERFHPTQKPVKLFSACLSDYSKESEIIIDFYSGSGTTLIACENLGRKCRAIEISPAYVAVALERYATAFPDKEIKKLE